MLYGTGEGATVGVAGQAALVGFPLELTDGEGPRAALVGALLDFVSL